MFLIGPGTALIGAGDLVIETFQYELLELEVDTPPSPGEQ